MNNAEKFKQTFGLYATELWSMPESDFLEWLNRDVETTQIDHIADSGKKVERTAETAQNTYSSCGQENDLISRQAALDAIMGQPPEPHYPSWYAAQIEKLPAVQPATNCSEIPNGSDDTISRQAAIDALRSCQTYLFDAEDPDKKIVLQSAEIAIEDLPSAQPNHIADISKKAEKEDCISRRAAIDLFPNDALEWDTKGGYIAPHLANRMIKELPSAQPEPHWIPCSERLPEKPCYCLTSNEYGNVCDDFYYGEDSFDKASKYNYEVLAWKPLPEPYR